MKKLLIIAIALVLAGCGSGYVTTEGLEGAGESSVAIEFSVEGNVGEGGALNLAKDIGARARGGVLEDGINGPEEYAFMNCTFVPNTETASGTIEIVYTDNTGEGTIDQDDCLVNQAACIVQNVYIYPDVDMVTCLAFYWGMVPDNLTTWSDDFYAEIWYTVFLDSNALDATTMGMRLDGFHDTHLTGFEETDYSQLESGVPGSGVPDVAHFDKTFCSGGASGMNVDLLDDAVGINDFGFSDVDEWHMSAKITDLGDPGPSGLYECDVVVKVPFTYTLKKEGNLEKMYDWLAVKLCNDVDNCATAWGEGGSLDLYGPEILAADGSGLDQNQNALIFPTKLDFKTTMFQDSVNAQNIVMNVSDLNTDAGQPDIANITVALDPNDDVDLIPIDDFDVTFGYPFYYQCNTIHMEVFNVSSVAEEILYDVLDSDYKAGCSVSDTFFVNANAACTAACVYLPSDLAIANIPAVSAGLDEWSEIINAISHDATNAELEYRDALLDDEVEMRGRTVKGVGPDRDEFQLRFDLNNIAGMDDDELLPGGGRQSRDEFMLGICTPTGDCYYIGIQAIQDAVVCAGEADNTCTACTAWRYDAGVMQEGFFENCTAAASIGPIWFRLTSEESNIYPEFSDDFGGTWNMIETNVHPDGSPAATELAFVDLSAAGPEQASRVVIEFNSYADDDVVNADRDNQVDLTEYRLHGIEGVAPLGSYDRDIDIPVVIVPK